MNWKADILEAPPTSGKFEEVLFGEKDGSFTWIQFATEQISWIGIFHNGRPAGHSKVFVCDDIAIILAEGIIYGIDLITRKCQYKNPKEDFKDLIADCKSFFAADFNSIHVFEQYNQIKILQAFYFDMFEFTSITPTDVHFKCYQFGGDWQQLKIDRDKMEIINFQI